MKSKLPIILAALLAGGAGLYLATRHFPPASVPAANAPTLASIAPQMRAVRLITTPRVLPDWKLRLADGGEATPATLQGHWTVVFLGFTHCPDVCPTTLAELAKAQKAWMVVPAAKRPRLVF